jgi:hypothetical protein
VSFKLVQSAHALGGVPAVTPKISSPIVAGGVPRQQQMYVDVEQLLVEMQEVLMLVETELVEMHELL